MKDDDKLRVKCKIDNVINILESGSIKEELAQYAIVEQLIIDIFDKVDGEEQKKTLKNFLKTQIRLKVAMEEKQKKINEIIAQKPENILLKERYKLEETFGKNMQKIYKIVKDEKEKIDKDYV